MCDDVSNGQEHSHKYSFRGHRDALYSVLEAAVREGEKHGTYDVDISADEGFDREGERASAGAAAQAIASKSYPTPILWHEQMASTDLDAYHAAQTANAGTAFAESAHPLCGRDDQTFPGRMLLESMGGDNRSEQGERGRDLKNDQLAHDNDSSRVPSVMPGVQHSRTCESSSDGPVEDEKEMRRQQETVSREAQGRLCTPVGPSRKMKQPSPRTAGPSREGAQMPLVTTNNTQRGGRNLAQQPQHSMTVSAECTVAKEPSASRLSPQVDEVGRQGQEFRSHDSEDSDHFDDLCPAEGEAQDQSREMAMTHSAPTQAGAVTQTMFLPGLPSQLLISQQSDDDTPWGNGEAEEGTPQPERPIASIPSRAPAIESCTDPDEGAADSHPVDGKKKSTDRCIPRERDSIEKSVQDSHANGREDRLRQYDEFAQAVLKNFGPQANESDDRNVEQHQPTIDETGPGRRSKPNELQPFALVPVEDALPYKWQRGREGALSTLERHLAWTRERFPDGFVARALELAICVFRQPTVCIRTREAPRFNRGRPERAFTSQHAEIVGVSGVVWDILSASEGEQDKKQS